MESKKVINFWFEELTNKDWFKKSEEIDHRISKLFSKTLAAAKVGELAHWRKDALGRLAEIIVLDQFSRNIFRDDARAFEADPLALVLSQEMIAHALDKELNASQQSFCYMPFMHSESALIHKQALELFDRPGLENNLKFEQAHKKIIDLFGRYPHRNEVLGRESSREELEYLKDHPGF